MKPIFAIFGILLLSVVAYGGAWGMGAFDNDDALDWLLELESSSGVSVLEDALEDVTGSWIYIGAPECSRAVAAAEVVAAMVGKRKSELPDEVKSWIGANDIDVENELVRLANKAVTLIRDSSKSELAELWRDSGAAYDEWHAEMSDLIKRLS